MLRLMKMALVFGALTVSTAAFANDDQTAQKDDYGSNKDVQEEMSKNDAGNPDMTLEEAYKNVKEDAKTVQEKAKDAYNDAKKKVTE